MNKDTVQTPEVLQGRYEFLGRLGEGSQGSVFRARRVSDGQIVAVKRIRIDSVNTWKEYDLFQRESNVLSTLQERGIAKFYESIECLQTKNPAAYIVQELIEGRSLFLMRKQGFRFTLSRIFQMAFDLLSLLERLHTHEPPIIHRDIKPKNIIMKPLNDRDTFEPYLIDFGAVANPTVQKGGSTVAGTYGYMPPEQLVGRPCPASDIYALGVTIVYMLCGVDPADMRVADHRLVIDPYLQNYPRSVVSTLHRILDPRPDTRLCDYNTLRSIFRQFANDDFCLDDAESLLPAERIEKQILAVNAFNQAGNLDLWMALPEQTPRTVPGCLVDTVLNYDLIDEKRRLEQKLPREIITVLLIAAACGGVMFLLFTKSAAFAGVGVVILIFGILFLLGAVVFVGSSFATRSRIVRQGRKRYHFFQQEVQKPSTIKAFCSYEHADDVPMLTLLKFGQKTIATIIDFEDIPIELRYREYNSFSRNLQSRSRIPFRLRYRFNPPDDASPNDLIHEVTIYNHQTEGLEPGSPLPILYYIDPNDNSIVYSMPYPIPFVELQQTQLTLIHKQNLYCQTAGIYQ